MQGAGIYIYIYINYCCELLAFSYLGGGGSKRSSGQGSHYNDRHQHCSRWHKLDALSDNFAGWARVVWCEGGVNVLLNLADAVEAMCATTLTPHQPTPPCSHESAQQKR